MPKFKVTKTEITVAIVDTDLVDWDYIGGRNYYGPDKEYAENLLLELSSFDFDDCDEITEWDIDFSSDCKEIK